MDITPHFLAAVLLFGLFMLWWIDHRGSFYRNLQRIERTQGKRAAWEWYLGTPEWQKRRQATFRAFDYKCADCGSPNNLQAHHRTRKAYQRLGREKPIIDLTALCAPCHARAPRSDGLY